MYTQRESEMGIINRNQVGIEARFSFVVGKSERRAVRKLLSEMKIDGRKFTHIEKSRWFSSDFHVLGEKDDRGLALAEAIGSSLTNAEAYSRRQPAGATAARPDFSLRLVLYPQRTRQALIATCSVRRVCSSAA
jgi:hypothetical protein